MEFINLFFKSDPGRVANCSYHLGNAATVL
jgi:hypothetical protein